MEPKKVSQMKVEVFRRMHFKKGKFAQFNSRKQRGKSAPDVKREPKVQDPRWKEL